MLVFGAPAAAQECGHPLSTGAMPTASDALYTLRAGVGISQCDILVCDVDANCQVSATDALVLLRASVGQQVEMNCAAGCFETTTTLAPTTTTLPAATWADVFDVFQAYNCGTSGCHGSSSFQGDLPDLNDYDDGYDALVGTQVFCNGSFYGLRVVPGNPDSSFLVAKLEGFHDCGSAMPLGSFLAQEDLDVVRSWIAAGAAKGSQ